MTDREKRKYLKSLMREYKKQEAKSFVDKHSMYSGLVNSNVNVWIELIHNKLLNEKIFMIQGRSHIAVIGNFIEDEKPLSEKGFVLYNHDRYSSFKESKSYQLIKDIMLAIAFLLSLGLGIIELFRYLNPPTA